MQAMSTSAPPTIRNALDLLEKGDFRHAQRVARSLGDALPAKLFGALAHSSAELDPLLDEYSRHLGTRRLFATWSLPDVGAWLTAGPGPGLRRGADAGAEHRSERHEALDSIDVRASFG